MDIEFCVDKEAHFPGNLFIVQARQKTIWSRKKKETLQMSPMEYIAKDSKRVQSFESRSIMSQPLARGIL